MKTDFRKYIVAFSLIGLVFGKTGISNFSPKTNETSDVTMPSQSVININNMAYWMKKSSAGTTSGSPNGTQVDYPIGTGGLIYEDGMLWGVKVSDGNSQSPRVGGTTYYAGLKAGRVVYDGEGNVIGSTDPSSHHVWRVRTDFMTANLQADADNVGLPVESVYEQYEYDWNNWPAAWGAPYHDVDLDGSYDPAVDIPGYPGADQTLWVVANDIPLIVNSSGDSLATQNTAPNVYGADPVGVELQVTLWAYKFGAADPLGNIVFKRAKMKYTGLPGGPADAKVDTAYFTQWSDPDLGTYTDDYVGCDVGLSFGYVYNGNSLDGVFNGIYNLPVPSGGYDFLQGPENNLNVSFSGGGGEGAEDIVPTVLPMTSFTYFGAGSSISDPDLSSYSGSLQFFNLMEGFLPRPEYPEQVPWTDLSTGQETNFVLSGDPVAGTGWVDGVQLPPGDRRLVMASGPFSMNLGDEQVVVLALIGGMGGNAISSVTVAKFHDETAQYAYNNSFDLPSAPKTPVVAGLDMDGAIALEWGSDAATVASTETDISKGFEFEGYNVYQIPSAGSPLSEGKRIATFDKINLIKDIFDRGVDPVSGYILEQVKQTGTDAGVQRYFSTDYDELRLRPMSNGITYYYAVTAYSYLPLSSRSYDDLGEPLDPFITLESTPAIVAVVPRSVNPGETINSQTGGDVATDHEGTAGGNVTVHITNPEELTGDSYEVNFNLQHYYRDLAGSWQMSNYPDSVGRTLGKVLDCSPSTVTASAIASSNIGTVDLVLTYDMVCPGGAWVDGLQFDLPDDIVVNSWAPVSGCSYASSGQNCVNQEGTLGAGNVLTYGDSARSEFGMIEGGQVIVVNVQPFDFPQDVSYHVWDDGYDGTVVDASGTTTVSELGYEFKTIKHWNLVNTSSGEILLEDMFTMNGTDLENIVGGVYNSGGAVHGSSAMGTTDGFYVNVSVGYSAPTNYESISDGGVFYGSSSYTIGSYADYGWAVTAKSSDAYGAGHTTVDYLQRDVKVVWDGVYGDPLENGFIPVVSGGSQVWLYGARNGDLTNHPSPENPGTGDPFLITVPFKVYDMEAGDEPVQISLIVYDRIQAAGTGYDGSYDGNGDGTPEYHAFNPYNRMYTEFLNRPYEETLADFASNEAHLTWNTVWWGAPYSAGDEILFVYANPIQQGVDRWTFTTVKNTTGGAVSQEDIDMINVYPNPYYGFHELETSRSEKYVSFNHLPATATIRIFNLGGTMVRQIDKNDAGQYATWDLANQYGYPVASGLYIVHVETDFGEKVLKLALVQETQVLKYY